jgi:hypothetical protein
MQDVEYGYCGCGCDEKTKIAAKTSTRQGQIKGQPNRYLAGHRPAKHPDYVEEDRGYETPCWIWQGAKDWDGYGLLKRGGVSGGAHRWYYTKLVGPIPEGLTLDHLCYVRDCVNPAHLEPKSHAENVRLGRHVNTAKTHCKHGHEFTPENTYMNSGHRVCRACRRAYEKTRRLEAEPKPGPQST